MSELVKEIVRDAIGQLQQARESMRKLQAELLSPEGIDPPEQPAVEGVACSLCGKMVFDSKLHLDYCKPTPPPGQTLRERARDLCNHLSNFEGCNAATQEKVDALEAHLNDTTAEKAYGVLFNERNKLQQRVDDLEAALDRADVEAKAWEEAMAELRQHMTCNHLRVCASGQVMDGKPNIVCSNHRYLAALPAGKGGA